MDYAYYEALQKKLGRILDSVKASLAENELEEIESYINANECGLAFEGLCFIIRNEQLSIQPHTFELINGLGREMSFEPSVWEDLISLVNS